MNRAISKEQQALHTLIAEAESNLSSMQERLHRIGDELKQVAAEKEQYQLLTTVCDSLDRLQELGAAELFWGDNPLQAEAHLARARGSVAGFHERIGGREQAHSELAAAIREQMFRLEALNDELAELKEQEQRRLDEFVVEREIDHIPYRVAAMPWSKQGEDESRFRKTMLASLVVSILFGVTTYRWTLPPPDLNQPVEIPERLARLVRPPEPPPPPPPREEEERPQETREEVAEAPQAEPTPVERQEARRAAESAGVLAFSNSFADLIDNAPAARLGVDARVTNAGQQAQGGQTQRSIVTASARTGSGGIDTAALSRDVGGGRDAVGEVTFARVDSAIGTDMQDRSRPLSDTQGPSRTDEEIQIVFDRYKATLYRIYNMELRRDPTLQGNLVLRITIEPDGSVSAVRAESTTLASADLVGQMVDRVKRFNFGPKEGVPTVTILYPIDFLPAG